MDKNEFMKEAVLLSRKSIESGGGPFGALVVKDGEIIGRGRNLVASTFDPTAHAEITAIRDAAAHLGDFDLEGCEIYSSCEPCPMCLGAIYWARIKKVYYANTQEDAEQAGFADKAIYKQIGLPMEQRDVKMIHVSDPDARAVMDAWAEMEDKVEY